MTAPRRRPLLPGYPASDAASQRKEGAGYAGNWKSISMLPLVQGSVTAGWAGPLGSEKVVHSRLTKCGQPGGDAIRYARAQRSRRPEEDTSLPQNALPGALTHGNHLLLLATDDKQRVTARH